MRTNTVMEIAVEKTDFGYRCRAVTIVKGKESVFSFLLTPSTYGAIEERLGRPFDEADVRQLAEVRIRQRIENGGLPGDFGDLDSREVDGLFSDIRRGARPPLSVRR